MGEVPCKPCCKTDDSPKKSTIMTELGENEMAENGDEKEAGKEGKRIDESSSKEADRDAKAKKKNSRRASALKQTGGGEEEGPDNNKKIEFLSRIPLFSKLPQEMLASIFTNCVEMKYNDGQEIITQGETSSDLFVIIKGFTDVIVGGNNVAKLTVGDYFGESGLLKAVPRTATVRANGKVITIMLKQAAFKKLDLENQIEIIEKANATSDQWKKDAEEYARNRRQSLQAKR